MFLQDCSMAKLYKLSVLTNRNKTSKNGQPDDSKIITNFPFQMKFGLNFIKKILPELRKITSSIHVLLTFCFSIDFF